MNNAPARLRDVADAAGLALDPHAALNRPNHGAQDAMSARERQGVLTVLRQRGPRVPRDPSVVAVDDVSPLALVDPPLTAVRRPVARIGRRAVERVIAPNVTASVERPPMERIVRSAVAAPAGRA